MELNAIDEGWFSSRLETEQTDTNEWLAACDTLVNAKRNDEALAQAQRLFKKLTEDDAIDAALRVLAWLVEQGALDNAEEAVNKLLAKDRNALKMVEPAGFGGTLPVAECFKRLAFLRSLKPGMLCLNATWGFGIIEDIDPFYQQIEINFTGKGEHEMAFSYAAEALERLDDQHLLAMKHKQPAEIARLIKEDPAEVVRIALRSYGAMPIQRLQDTLSPAIIPEADWKKFWAAARAVLKNDASVEIPKKRSDNIVLHAKALAYDDEWFALLADERDIETLFSRFKEILEKQIETTSAYAKQTLADRLAFIIRGAPSAHPEWKAEGFIYARLLEIEPAGIDTAKLIHDLIDDDLVTTFDRLAARQLQTLLSILLENDRAAVIAILSEIIPVVSHPVLNEIMASLLTNGAEEKVRALMTTAVSRRTASAPMLLWCQRFPEWIEKWNLIPQGDLAFRIQEILEVDSCGAMLRAQNQLREKFQQEEWLHGVMMSMTAQQRRDFLRRLNEGPGWDVLDRKSVVAKILRKFPELQDIIVPTKNGAPIRREIPRTSARSYAARQKQLERIMTVEIPENSKEIEVARSYGDLRENAEFKYAKERQGLLMAQGAQLAEDLEKVKPTDFAGIPTDEVAMGTGVELVYPGGATDTYFILGVWDQDETLSIISSETRLAKALIGHAKGETVAIPAGECEIKAILPLPDVIREWIKG